MIRHIALFRFADGIAPEDVSNLDVALARLPSLISAIEAYDTGSDLGITTGAWDYGIVADFASQADYDAYANHPDHIDVVTNIVKPLITDVARIQFEV